MSSVYGEERWSSLRNTCQKTCVQQIYGYFLYPDKSYLQKKDIKEEDVWVEVSMGKRKRSQSPFRDTYAQHTKL